MSLNRMFDAIASRYQWRWQEGGERFWIMEDEQNQITFGIELEEVDVWMWSLNALVIDVDAHSTVLDPGRLLRWNDGKGDDGLVWCFYSIGKHDLGESLYLKYGAMTPLGDLTFASQMVASVLRNMQKFTIRTRLAVR